MRIPCVTISLGALRTIDNHLLNCVCVLDSYGLDMDLSHQLYVQTDSVINLPRRCYNSIHQSCSFDVCFIFLDNLFVLATMLILVRSSIVKLAANLRRWTDDHLAPCRQGLEHYDAEFGSSRMVRETRLIYELSWKI